jgi:flagellar M-ring protein FliF
MQSVWHATLSLKRRLDAVPAWAGLLVAALMICMAAALVWQFQSARMLTASGEYLLEGKRFTDSQLSAIVQALARSKLADYSIQDHRIRVPQGQSSLYLTALAEGGALPHDFHSHTAAAVKEVNIFESDRDRRDRMLHARESDLAQVIRSIDGIDDAMVQFDEVEQRGFRGERILTASVAVRPVEGQSLDRRQIRALRCLVSAAKAGMRPEDVTIIDARSGQSYVDSEEQNLTAPLAEEYLRAKRAVEHQWQQKVVQVLTFVPTAQVAVDVELSPGPSDSVTSPTTLS